jgi:hypothetical protein
MSETKAAAPEQSDASETASDAQEQADFGAGFDDTKTSPSKSDKSEKSDPATQARETVETDEKGADDGPVTISRKEWAEIKAAAAKTASYDQQFSKLFGHTGNIQRLLNEQKAAATPEQRRGEIPKEAFADLERDYPEIARKMRPVLEHMQRVGANDADTAKLETLWAQQAAKRELEVLEDAYPDWRTITGAVDATTQQPDPDNAFRKWLTSKDAAYQQRVNASESAAVIGRAIRTFQRETASAKPVNGTPRDAARADRIRSAVQPRGPAPM